VMKFGIRKLESGLPDGEEIMTLVSSFWHNTGAWRTRRRTRCCRKDPRIL